MNKLFSSFFLFICFAGFTQNNKGTISGIIKDKVNGIIPISEEDIISTMQMIWERMKIIVEPSCSIALAAVLNNKNIFSDKKVGLILSGGNVDLDQLPWYD